MATRPARQLAVKSLPVDWDEQLHWRGYSRNLTSKAWMVRLFMNDKQEFIGFADTQEEAARLYDLALWRIAPKLTRKLKPNFPEDFGDICQDKVDRVCPRLNELFKRLPWVREEDEVADHDAMRNALLAGPRNGFRAKGTSGLSYDKRLFELKRLRISVNQHAQELALMKFSMPGFQKLAEAPRAWDDLVSDLNTAGARLNVLIASMENQRSYYEALNQTLPKEEL